MVFCRECKRQVDDCPHFVYPIQAPRTSVFDPKIETLAYSEPKQILEIVFKSGQVWQLFGVPSTIYTELRDTSISSFLRFIAHRYKSAPVKTGISAIVVPQSEPCPRCKTAMEVTSRAENSIAKFIRVFWKCPQCEQSQILTYGNYVSSKSDRKGSKWR